MFLNPRAAPAEKIVEPETTADSLESDSTETNARASSPIASHRPAILPPRIPTPVRTQDRPLAEPKATSERDNSESLSHVTDAKGATPDPLADPLGFLLRNTAYLLAGAVAAVVLALAVDLMMNPRYRATSQILIGPFDLRLVEKSVVPPAQSPDANVIQVESETRILTSDRVLRRVVDSERLATDPEFQMRRTSLVGGAITSLRAAMKLPPEPTRIADPELDALRLLQRDVNAKRTERTYVVDLTVETSDPEKSARLANAIAMAYLDEQTDARADVARRATETLSSRLNEQRERVRQAEEQVELYKAQHNIVGASGRLVDEQQLTDLNNQLITARARTVEANGRYQQMQALQRSGGDHGATSEAIQSNTLGRLREQYSAIARQEANLASELGPRHPWVLEARAQLRNAQKQITDEIARIAESNRSDYERALANEQTLERNLDALKQRSKNTGLAFIKLRELEREVDASRAVYESFLVRARETREQERLDTANVRILADAQSPQDRNWPPRRLPLLLSLLAFGVGSGAMLAYLVALYRRRPRAPGLTLAATLPAK